MSQQLFIPDKIRVGVQNRKDTYTQKLAYVIYYDQKNTLRKEKSWETWRDKGIEPVDFANEPTEGFVLNKGVGGARRSYGWNVRNEYIRVYDPRDFEFEISIANLLFILRECDCSKGKGLESKFVYAWDGTELVLLPTISDDYQQCKRYTELQGKVVKAKDLILGASYTTKKVEILTYLGRFDYHSLVVQSYRKSEPAVAKKHIFWNGKWFVVMSDLKQIAALNSEMVAPDYAELVDKFHLSAHGSKVVKLFLKDAGKRRKAEAGRGENWAYEQSPGVFIECETNWSYDKPPKISNVRMRERIELKDDGVYVDNYYATAYPPTVPHNHYLWGNDQKVPWVEPTGKHLWAILESGQEYRYSYQHLVGDKPQEVHDGEEGDD